MLELVEMLEARAITAQVTQSRSLSRLASCGAAMLFACQSGSNGGVDSGRSLTDVTDAPVIADDRAAMDTGPANDSGADAGEEAADVQIAECATPEAMRPPGAVCVRRVSGRVIDLAGAAIANHVVSVCGSVCFYGRTNSDGSFLVRVGEWIPPAEYTVQGHGRPDHATQYLPLGTNVPASGEMALSEPLVLPRYTDVGPEIPETAMRDLELTAGDVTLSIPNGAQQLQDFEDVDLGALGWQLRSARVPVAQSPAFVRAAGLVALWAMAPFHLVSDRSMGIRVRNPDSMVFAAGAAVEFVALGINFFPPPVDAGTVVVVGSGHVSADGSTIATDPGVGTTVIRWLGVRAPR